MKHFNRSRQSSITVWFGGCNSAEVGGGHRGYCGNIRSGINTYYQSNHPSLTSFFFPFFTLFVACFYFLTTSPHLIRSLQAPYCVSHSTPSRSTSLVYRGIMLTPET